MQTFSTIIKAIDQDGNLSTFAGPNIMAISRQLAHDFCQNNGLGYLQISDRILYEIDIETGLRIYFEQIELN